MDVFDAKNELRRMKKSDLLKLALDQRMSRCMIGSTLCGFYLRYKRFNFCISEIFGESCLVEKLAKSEGREQQDSEEINFSLPLIEKIEKIPLSVEKKTTEFKVYCRDQVTRSINFLGRIIERRVKERGNNLKDLLIKARKDFSDRVSDPSFIFLSEP